METEEENNPELEALQQELSRFRKSPFVLSGSDLEQSLGDLIKKSEQGRSTAFAFVGMPGAGKSKLIDKASRLFETDPTHVRDLGLENPEIRKLEKEFYRISEIIPGIERDYLELAFKKRSEHYLLDGFPRTIFQALELYRYAVEKKIHIRIVELRLQEDKEVFQSFYRQTQRAIYRIKKGLLFGSAEEEEVERIFAKIKRTIELDLYVIETLRALGADILVVNATFGPSKMFAELKEKLGITSDD